MGSDGTIGRAAGATARTATPGVAVVAPAGRRVRLACRDGDVLPEAVRGPEVHEVGLPVPPGACPGARPQAPEALALRRGLRPGVHAVRRRRAGRDVPLNFWAVVEPDGRIRERTTLSGGGVQVGGARHSRERARRAHRPEAVAAGGLGPGGGRLAGRRPVHMDAQASAPAAWHDASGGRRARSTAAFIDDSAGYHERHTAWKWSAGVGSRVAESESRGTSSPASTSAGWKRADGLGRRACDGGRRSGSARACPDRVGGRVAPRFASGGRATDNTNLLLFRSRYRQPFGAFTGTLPGGVELAAGYGVMEDHDVFW